MTVSTAADGPQTTISWARCLAQALEAQNINSRALFEEVGIPFEHTTDPLIRIPSGLYSKLHQRVVEITNDPSFPLKSVIYVHPASLHALGYSLYASKSLYEMFQRIVRFFPLVSDNVIHDLHESDNEIMLSLRAGSGNLGIENQEVWAGLVVHLCRSVYRPNYNPIEVRLSRPKPIKYLNEFDRFFKCSVVFSADEWAIRFEKSDVMASLPAGCAELARRSDEIVMEHLMRREKRDIVRRVESKIVELLPMGNCNVEKVAANLNMSQRNLFNKLRDKGTSYQIIFDELRSNLARQYIDQNDISVTEITFLLGFSDVSNFTRAFRRWTGMAPTQYRNKNYPLDEQGQASRV